MVPLASSLLPLTRMQGPVGCVDYKYNPLIIAGCMEDFNGGGESRALNSNGGAARTLAAGAPKAAARHDLHLHSTW